MEVGFIGLGKLGLVSAEIMAQKYSVTGYDVRPTSSSSVKITPHLKDAVIAKDFIFVAVDTPHDPAYGGETPSSHLPTKNFNYENLQSVLEQINTHVNHRSIVVIISTVLPGTVRSTLAPLLPNAALLYNPYLVAMGTIIDDFKNPEMMILGSRHRTDSHLHALKDFYTPLLDSKSVRFELGTWEDAESIKIFYNTFISAKLALVNMIQDVALKNGHIDPVFVARALANSTQRITSPAYMMPGMGDGGPCHPRDNIALSWLSEKLELGYDLFRSIMICREQQALNMAKAVSSWARTKNIVIVGKSYKPNTPLTDGSPSLLVGHYLESQSFSVSYYDPQTGDSDFVDSPEAVYLISFWSDWVGEITFPKGCTVVDTTRRLPLSDNYRVIYYARDSHLNLENE